MPYLFLKPSQGAVIGHDDAIVIPYGRDRTDWEVELGTVIGRTAKYVSAADAQDYVFGYTVSIDVSDRGGRPPGGNGMTSDWFVGKGHDTFAPQGPWIVPKEFYGDPMQNLRQTLSVGGTQLQEAQAGDMIHSLWEVMEYASSIITLFPGDVINNGTSGGTAAGSAATRGEEDRYLKPGEVIEAVWHRWLAHDPLERVDACADAIRTMTLIVLDAGTRDEHGLHFGHRLLAERLRAVGAAAVELNEFDGGHRGTSHRYALTLPRIAQVLHQ